MQTFAPNFLSSGTVPMIRDSRLRKTTPAVAYVPYKARKVGAKWGLASGLEMASIFAQLGVWRDREASPRGPEACGTLIRALAQARG